MSSPREDRRTLGSAAVFGEAEAVRLLPFRDTVARAWLRSRGLVHEHPELGRYVLWAEVLAALGQAEPPPGPTRGSLPRAGVYRR